MTGEQKYAVSVGMLHAWRLITERLIATPIPDTPMWKLIFSRKARRDEIYELGRLRGMHDAIQIIRRELEPEVPE